MTIAHKRELVQTCCGMNCVVSSNFFFVQQKFYCFFFLNFEKNRKHQVKSVGYNNFDFNPTICFAKSIRYIYDDIYRRAADGAVVVLS